MGCGFLKIDVVGPAEVFEILDSELRIWDFKGEDGLCWEGGKNPKPWSWRVGFWEAFWGRTPKVWFCGSQTREMVNHVLCHKMGCRTLCSELGGSNCVSGCLARNLLSRAGYWTDSLGAQIVEKGVV